MTLIEDLYESVERLRVFEELDVEPAVLPRSAQGLSDAAVRDALALTAALARRIGVLQSVLAGIAAARSTRERGHRGLVQESGHRNVVEFIRDVTGSTRGEAVRAVRVGEALLDSAAAETDAPPSTPVWHDSLNDSVLSGVLTTAQADVIRTGLGEPPAIDGAGSTTVVTAWRAAASELAAEATRCTVEDLAARARTLRELLDPRGAEERFAARFVQRSYRWSISPDGLRRAHITFDDEMGEWIRGLMDAALAPRRGGPRFVAQDQQRDAEELKRDPRTNEQLAYDVFVDVFRAGALADSARVYGAREAGVRLIVMKDAVTGETAQRDAFGRLLAVAHSTDGALSVPGSALQRLMCATGSVEVSVDTCGNPLDVGREARLFTPKQKLALSVRDGGCLWPGCDRPPEYCEAHHIDPWVSGGVTDCDRGVLLCRYHHLFLHNAGWSITRDREGPFLLHAPTGSGEGPFALQSKSPLRWLWDPPPDRVGWRSAA